VSKLTPVLGAASWPWSSEQPAWHNCSHELSGFECLLLAQSGHHGFDLRF
jgi:hypothetical protein